MNSSYTEIVLTGMVTWMVCTCASELQHACLLKPATAYFKDTANTALLRSHQLPHICSARHQTATHCQGLLEETANAQ